MNSHTPGPWRLIALDDGQQWLTDGTNGFSPDAVPDLLAACRAISESVPCQSDHCRHYGLAHGKPCNVEAIRMVRIAIAKAQP